MLNNGFATIDALRCFSRQDIIGRRILSFEGINCSFCCFIIWLFGLLKLMLIEFVFEGEPFRQAIGEQDDANRAARHQNRGDYRR